MPKLRPEIADEFNDDPSAPPDGERRSEGVRPAIFPAPSASLEPEGWLEVDSGFRRIRNSTKVRAPENLPPALLKEPQIPRAPSIPRLHVPPARYPVGTRPPVSPEDDISTDSTEIVHRSNRRTRKRSDQAWGLQAARIAFAGAVAVALAYLSGLF